MAAADIITGLSSQLENAFTVACRTETQLPGISFKLSKTGVANRFRARVDGNNPAWTGTGTQACWDNSGFIQGMTQECIYYADLSAQDYDIDVTRGVWMYLNCTVDIDFSACVTSRITIHDMMGLHKYLEQQGAVEPDDEGETDGEDEGDEGDEEPCCKRQRYIQRYIRHRPCAIDTDH